MQRDGESEGGMDGNLKSVGMLRPQESERGERI